MLYSLMRIFFLQTLAVMNTRAIPQGIELRVGKYQEFEPTPEVFACILQYPNSDGSIEDYRSFTEKAHEADCKVAVAADLLSLALIVPPGEWGADIVFGTTQRLGTPMFYGGPSAAYFATRDEFKRNMPGRIIGWSKDKYGKMCYLHGFANREQHTNVKKLLPTSVLPRHYWLQWQDSMLFIMVNKASRISHHVSTVSVFSLKKRSANWDINR